MFHVSFLVKEGKAKIFLENGLAVIKPVKPKRPGHSAAAREDDIKNQVTKCMWIKFMKTEQYSEIVTLMYRNFHSGNKNFVPLKNCRNLPKTQIFKSLIFAYIID